MTRIPILAGSRVAIAHASDDAVVLAPPAPAEPVADVAAAVRDALRFPLSGEPLEAVVPRGARVTIVVEPPAFPVPGVPNDPRQIAIAATVDELERRGVPLERQTLLIAGGLARRAGRRELESLVSPEFARRFRGRVMVHDAESEDLVPILGDAPRNVRVNRALVETDAVVTVTAAETVIHGGPSCFVAAADAQTCRAAGAYSLLETTASQGWQTGVAIERALGARVPVVGVSLVLTFPRFSGLLQGFPYDSRSVERVVRSPSRALFGLLPAVLRRHALRSIPSARGVSIVYAGPPSVAHAEALLRGTEQRATSLEEPLDALCIGVPFVTPYLPREAPNPLLAAYVALGLALRLWRDAFPIVEGGTAILVHPFERRFAHPSQIAYREFFRAVRGLTARDLSVLRQAELAAGADARGLEAYRSGRAHHPLLPYADWSSCGPALGRLGAVVVAGCRDHDAARALGFVPTVGIGAALQMVRGRSGATPRVGFLLAPPYFPLAVGGA